VKFATPKINTFAMAVRLLIICAGTPAGIPITPFCENEPANCGVTECNIPRKLLGESTQ
jgi:hypothetical protein